MSDGHARQNYCHFGNMIIPFMRSRDAKSPPKVDEASLQQAMDKNKESLKVKLMTRRPINQLVEQGILPSLKVTPHFHEQRQKLERAKTGDFLKNKIQRRPDRQALIQQHILEDTTVDPSLHDKQRQLKKARLADDLNDRLSHRPGPLELVKGNILQADEKFAQAVKEGQIQFKRTCEGQSLRHPPPSFVVEEDSGSDVALSPPQDNVDQSYNSLPSVDAFLSSPYSNLDSPNNRAEPKSTIVFTTSASSSPTSVPSPTSSQSSFVLPVENVHKDVPSGRIRKKSKPKSQPKPRTIKFHEYKGPPSAQKNQASLSPSETSYELLLKQQQLFLQWQLEWQQMYPQMILPVPPKSITDQNGINGQSTKDQRLEQPAVPPPKWWSKLEDMKVSDLKSELKKRNLPVSGSKPQLIERLKPYLDLTNIGNKKLGVVADQNTVVSSESSALSINVSGIILDTISTLATKPKPVASVVAMDTSVNRAPMTLPENGSLVVYNTVPVQNQLVLSRPSSAAPMDIEVPSPCSESHDSVDVTAKINEDIVKQQQKKIEELQRELQRSQLKLQQQQWLQQQAQQQALLVSQTVPLATVPPPTQLQQVSITSVASTLPQVNNIDAKALQKLQQHLQQKFQQQQFLQRLQQFGNANTVYPSNPAAVSAAVKANLAAFIHNQQNANAHAAAVPATTLKQQSVSHLASLQPIVFCQSGSYPNNAEKPRANSLPNGFGQPKLLWTSSLPNFSAVITAKPVDTANAKQSSKLPPDYNEATKQLTKCKQEQKSQCSGNSGKHRSRKSVKNQALDDVLEILIKNGELPASAAQEPATPTTPETPKSNGAAPVFPAAASSKVSVPPPAPPPPPPPTSEPMINSQSSVTSHNALPSSVLQGSAPDMLLNFDFQLDLHDIEAMDLGVLEQQNMNVQPESGPAKESQMSSDLGRVSDDGSCDKPMDVDMELSDWLSGLSAPIDSRSSNVNPVSTYNCGSDPLLSTMAGNHEMFDMFSLDDMDFKTSSALNWDKTDFAT